MPTVSAVVVGAGYAGLAASHHLAHAEIDHVVFERGRAGETWRAQRWDSFTLNTNNRISMLPGQTHEGLDPESFAPRDELLERFDRYVAERSPPLHTGVEVTRVERGPSTGFVVTTRRGDAVETWSCQHVIVASGFLNVPITPAVSKQLAPGILQMHTADYRNPEALPPGAVLVVGGAQSGCQIAEELVESGRRVFQSVSPVARVPRRYRGRDIIIWMIDSGFWDVRLEELDDPKIQYAAQPQVSGIGHRGHTISLQEQARRGIRLVGMLTRIDGHTCHFADDVATSVRFADERSAAFKKMLDGFIAKQGLDCPPAELDPLDAPDDGTLGTTHVPHLDLKAEGITSVIWCTGFTGAFDWIKLPVLDAKGQPDHVRGIAKVPGIYFLGAPWLSKRKSGVLWGMSEDAENVVRRIVEIRAGK